MKRRVTLHAQPGGEDAPTTQRRIAVDPLALLRLLVAKRRWIIGICTPVVILTAFVLFTTPNRFTSHATILPSGSDDSFSTLKAMVGLTGMLSKSDENSSALFPVILSSQLIRDAVLAETYQFEHDGKGMTVTLSEYFGRTNPDKLRRSLAGATAVSTDSRTGEITVAVETEYPQLSQLVVQEYLDQLESYNLHKRRSRARENQEYLARQIKEVKSDLRAVEDSLEVFRLANANWANTTSPEIMTELGRLTRELEVKSQTYLLLQQQHELAKLEAQKDVPIMRVLDAPTLPTIKSGPKRVINIALAGMISFMLVAMVIILGDLVRQAITTSREDGVTELKEEFTDAFPRTTRIINRISNFST